VRLKHSAELERLPDEGGGRHRRRCELNVVEQVQNVSQTTVVREAWARGQPLALHGWIYDVADGLLHDLGMCLASPR
jgi:carbonic anhydrase